MKALLMVFSTLTLPSTSYANVIEDWECKDFITPTNVLVKARINAGRTRGSISVAGITHETRFKVAGFDRRWDFGLEEDGSYAYAFVIRPDGRGTYYDFGSNDTSRPPILMRCRQASTLKR